MIGNSASGKSTLARGLEARHGLTHLDLDVVAWTEDTKRRPLAISQEELLEFRRTTESWVLEGCYADLAELTNAEDVTLLWLDTDLETCLAHADQRPFEPHKYASPADQAANLPMLRDWIRAYHTRDDEMSRSAHAALFERWSGPKQRLDSNTALLGHAVHPQLRADTHTIAELPSGTLLLHRNAALPWFILVPDVGPKDIRDLLDLDPDRLQQVLTDSQRIQSILREGGATKINFASLGNVVPQLHVHVIGRHQDDDCWPAPVWGNLTAGPEWSEDALDRYRAQL